jgi:hypothetical protein
MQSAQRSSIDSPLPHRSSFYTRLAVGLGVTSFACACGSVADGPRGVQTLAPEDAGDDSAPSSGTRDAALPVVDGSEPADADATTGGGDGAPGCPALTYPSGVKIQTFADATMTATYANHLASGESAPQCFLDVDRLVDPDTAQVFPITVNVAAHFTLDELVGTEVTQGYGHLVIMLPAAVDSLERFREALNTAVSVISGFRSPKHQEDVCNSLCGNPLGCPGTCANNSRHMFGDAFDLPLEFYTTHDEQLACDAGFKFAYLESGTHLHIDQNPAYATCVIE